jgi:hypothetical protein
MPPFIFVPSIMNSLPYSEYEFVQTSATLITQLAFDRIPTLSLDEFLHFVRTAYYSDDVAPYYLSALNSELFTLSKNVAVRMIIKKLACANLATPEKFPNAPGTDEDNGEPVYRTLHHHLPVHTLPPRFSPSPLSIITDCGNFFIFTFCVPIYAPLLTSCEIVILPLTPVGEEHESRGFSNPPKDHTCFATIMRDIQSIDSVEIIGLFYHNEILLFDHLYTALLQRHRINSFKASFYLPSTTRLLIGKQVIIQQLRCCFEAYGK